MDNGTTQIVTFEGALWFGLQFTLTWATYAQWMIIYFVDVLRIVSNKLRLWRGRSRTIANDAKRLSKIPKHLAIILGTEAELEDLANVVLWTFLLGTPYVTVHSKDGFHSTLFEEFVRICEQKKRELGEEMISISYHNSSALRSDNLSGCHLMMSSVHESREKLVSISRSICEQIQTQTLQPEDVDLNKMNEAFNDNLPEPELAISFSSYPCLHGLHPWNTRLTEIITVKSSKGITYPTYFDVLKQFAGTKQRLGK